MSVDPETSSSRGVAGVGDAEAGKPAVHGVTRISKRSELIVGAGCWFRSCGTWLPPSDARHLNAYIAVIFHSFTSF